MSLTLNPTTGKFDVVDKTKIGSTIKNGTSGSVLFIDSNGKLAQDNSELFWDDTNKRLGIGTASPSYALDIINTSSSQFRIGYDASNYTYINVDSTGKTVYKAFGSNGSVIFQAASGSGFDWNANNGASGGNLTFRSGVLRCYGGESNLIDLGLSTHTFKNLHLGSNAYIAGNVEVQNRDILRYNFLMS